MANNIYSKYKSAQMIASDFRKATGKTIPPAFVHWLAAKKGFSKHYYGKETYYASNLRTVLDSNYATMYPQYLKELEDMKKREEAKKQAVASSYNPDAWIEGNRNPRFESIIRKAIMESIDELELFHGTPHEFEQFDLAYLSSGFGQQSHGYGVYLTTSMETAKEYSQGKNIYTVEVPEGRYLNYDSISKRDAMIIARKFYKYYLTEHEYGKEAYAGHEDDFWEYECKYIGDCNDGGDVYGTISSLLGSDKDTSNFLYKIGYKGMFLKCKNTATGERFKNYVMFNEKDIKIIKKAKV